MPDLLGWVQRRIEANEQWLAEWTKAHGLGAEGKMKLPPFQVKVKTPYINAQAGA